MDVPEGRKVNICLKKLSAENLNIELDNGERQTGQISIGGTLLEPASTFKSKIYNQSTLLQKNLYWLLVDLLLGSLLFKVQKFFIVWIYASLGSLHFI